MCVHLSTDALVEFEDAVGQASPVIDLTPKLTTLDLDTRLNHLLPRVNCYRV